MMDSAKSFMANLTKLAHHKSYLLLNFLPNLTYYLNGKSYFLLILDHKSYFLLIFLTNLTSYLMGNDTLFNSILFSEFPLLTANKLVIIFA